MALSMRSETRPPQSAANGGGDALPAGAARALLRKLRDLNLRAHLRGGARIEGCLSLDRPVEVSVRYALGTADGPREIDLLLNGSVLEVVAEDEEGSTLHTARHALERTVDGLCRVEGVGVIDPEETRTEEVEAFLIALLSASALRRAS